MEEGDLVLREAWDELSDVPFYEDGEGCLRLEADWGIFAAGTDREKIWLWFDERYSSGVYRLMFPREGEARV